MCKRTVAGMMELPGRVYVWLETEDIAERFFAEAESEGFVFGDGEKPTSKQTNCIIAVNKNRTLNYVGFAGHAAFGSGTKTIGDELLIRVDYLRYISGVNDFCAC